MKIIHVYAWIITVLIWRAKYFDKNNLNISNDENINCIKYLIKIKIIPECSDISFVGFKENLPTRNVK